MFDLKTAFSAALAIAVLTASAMLVIVPADAQNPVDELARVWAESPHARVESEAFTHWDEEGEVPVECAACHSGPGFLDFIGADGTAAGAVDHPAPTGAAIDCATCHSDVADKLASVTFPSGATIDGLGPSARCMVCHQGRESTVSVNKATATLDPDTVSTELAFINIHYRAAAASLMGTLVKGAYKYVGKEYTGRFVHPQPVDTCAGCHDAHSTEVRVEECGACHQNQTLTEIRFDSTDRDGDGDASEGIAAEIATLHNKLLLAVAAYAGSIGSPIVYSPDAYPYFFNDMNGNGEVNSDEAVFPNRYQSWTPRLLRAAYNFQFVAKDPGIYAHNPDYAMQVLFDSIEDLGSAVGVDLGKAVRP